MIIGLRLSEEIKAHSENGRWQEQESGGGVARFCDFPFGKSELLVAAGSCFPVKVSNVMVVPYETITLSVIVNPCQGYPYWLSGLETERERPTMCIVQVRVKGEDGQPLEKVTVRNVSGAPFGELVKAIFSIQLFELYRTKQGQIHLDDFG